jgi:hypothetical protein
MGCNHHPTVLALDHLEQRLEAYVLVVVPKFLGESSYEPPVFHQTEPGKNLIHTPDMALSPGRAEKAQHVVSNVDLKAREDWAASNLKCNTH